MQNASTETRPTTFLLQLSLYVCQLQTYDKARNALALALSPVVRGLVDPDGAMQDIRNLDSVRSIAQISFVMSSVLLFLVYCFIPFLSLLADFLSLTTFVILCSKASLKLLENGDPKIWSVMCR